MEILDKIENIEITKRRSVLIVIIMFLMLIVVAMCDSGKYTEQEKQQIENYYNTCVNQEVEDLTFIAC